MKLFHFASTLALVGLASIASLAQAVTTTYDVSPADLAPGTLQFSAPHGTGTNPFGFDWDSAAPEIGPGAPAGFGSSSFFADVDSSGATQADRYRSFRIATTDLFPNAVTMGDIKSISYQTNKGTVETAGDWRVTIYTTAQGNAGDLAPWYRSRIQSQPQQSLSLNAPANQWNTWTTDDSATNQMQFYTNRTGFTAADIEFQGLTGGTLVRGANNWNFNTEGVMMLDITLGANTGGSTGASSLDAIRIELTNGDVAIINAVPEPGSLALASLGMLFVGRAAARRRRRQ